MDEMRADMGGAACVVATLYAVSQLKLPVNVIGKLLIIFLISYIFCTFSNFSGILYII